MTEENIVATLPVTAIYPLDIASSEKHEQQLSSMDIGMLAMEVHKLMRQKGWYDDERSFMDLGMLIASEAFEAFEDYRDNKFKTYFLPNGKPCGMVSEVADIAIRALDTIGALVVRSMDVGLDGHFMDEGDVKPIQIRDYSAYAIVLNQIAFTAMEKISRTTSRNEVIAACVSIVRTCDEFIASEAPSFDGTSLRREIKLKMDFNATRPHRHGNKLV